MYTATTRATSNENHFVVPSFFIKMKVFKNTICPYLNALATLVDIRFCYSLSYQLIYECQNQDAAKNTLPENAAVHTITCYLSHLYEGLDRTGSFSVK